MEKLKHHLECTVENLFGHIPLLCQSNLRSRVSILLVHMRPKSQIMSSWKLLSPYLQELQAALIRPNDLPKN